jgi:ribonuclease E
LGLVQMTRKRIGQGLLEVFSEPCESCQGRGYHVHSEPVVAKAAPAEAEGSSGRPGRRRKGGDGDAVESVDGDSGKAKTKGKRGTKAGGSSTPEVEVKAIDPAVSVAMEKIHAAAAKRAADAAAAAAAEAAGVEEPATAPPGTESEAVTPPAAPARRVRGSRKVSRPAGPATASDAAATGSGPAGESLDVAGATAG